MVSLCDWASPQVSGPSAPGLHQASHHLCHVANHPKWQSNHHFLFRLRVGSEVRAEPRVTSRASGGRPGQPGGDPLRLSTRVSGTLAG